VQVERGVGGRVRSMLESLGGIGLPGTLNQEDALADLVKLRQAGALAQQVDAPEKVTQLLTELFGVPVKLNEFIATWIEIPEALQSRIGRAYASLGRGATIGPRVFSRQGRIEIRIGPMALDNYKSFLRDGHRLPAMKRAVRDLLGEQFDVDLRVVLDRDEVPAPRIGAIQLGRTVWLARPRERGDADDMRLRTIVGWRPEPAGIAA
jgi:type VI secretion system protein ImpH